MITNITYEQLRAVIKTKGYNIKSASKLPDDLPIWTNTHDVNLTPEQANSILAHNATLNTLRNNKLDEQDSYAISANESDKFDNVIKLLPNYQIYSGQNVLKRIAKGYIPVDIRIIIKQPDVFWYEEENTYICKYIIDNIKEILTEQNVSLPDIDMSIWEKELPKRLSKELAIDIITPELKMKEDISLNIIDPITLVCILNSDRTDPYPDRLYMLKGINQTGIAVEYKCTALPINKDDYPNIYIIGPGMYEDVFNPISIDESIGAMNLIQQKGIPLYAPLINDNNQLVGYEDTAFKFMKVSIPVIDTSIDNDSSVVPTGIKFNNTNTEDMFITNLGIDYCTSPISYIVLESSDFE